MYPIVRYALPGLGDKGYPVARVLGLVLLGYFSWLSGSVGLPVTRLTILAVFLVAGRGGPGSGLEAATRSCRKNGARAGSTS